MLIAALSLGACTEQKDAGSSGATCGSELVPATKSDAFVSQATVGPMAVFTVYGLLQYQRYVPQTSPVRLDYTAADTRPIRRAVVQIMSGSTIVATGQSDDAGNYSIPVSVAEGTSLFVRVQARSVATAYAKDGLDPHAESCSGGSWDIRVVNNVTNNSCSASSPAARPLYALDGAVFTAPASGTVMRDLTASTIYSGGSYTARAGAPFALLDTAISGIETACQGRANIAFPVLYINWSKDNTSTSGNRYAGNIVTSFFTTETTSKIANLYILGKAGVDTDEFDDHVVAHEFGHYLENKIYRSDSIGGKHSLTDSLDPRLAFGEGFGNAFAGIVHNDPVYIDTNGTSQNAGFSIDVSQAPGTVDDRGPWSERSMQYMIYQTATSYGNFGSVHNILENFQKTSEASTTGLTFMSYYFQEYGPTGADVSNTWSGVNLLDMPLNALCTGSGNCVGSTAFSPFDTDNDLGFYFAAGATRPRRYRQDTGGTFDAEFWRLYRPLVSGVNTGNGHDRITFGNYTVAGENLNKMGLRRLYRITASAASTTVQVSSINQGSNTCSNGDLLDMAVYYKGTMIGLDEATTGATANCPRVTFSSTPGQTYIVEVAGFGTVASYNLTVSP